MYKLLSIFLPLFCCCFTTVLCQRSNIYYHYPVPRNPVNYNAQRLHQQHTTQRQVYEHFVPQTVARHYQNYPLTAAASNSHTQVAQQFASPDLENAAFLEALSQQGYKAHQSAAAVGAETYSLNVQLPLPLGLAPISAAPLPLQTGASFNGAHDYVTSYGTREVQRVKK